MASKKRKKITKMEPTLISKAEYEPVPEIEDIPDGVALDDRPKRKRKSINPAGDKDCEDFCPLDYFPVCISSNRCDWKGMKPISSGNGDIHGCSGHYLAKGNRLVLEKVLMSEI